MPEHIAVRAVGVAEQVDDTRRVGLAVGDPGGVLHLRPDFLGHRCIHQFFQRRLAQVLALLIEQAAHQHVFAIGSQVQRQAAVLVLGSIAAQAIGSVEAAFDFRAFGLQLLDGFGQVFSQHQLAGHQAQGQCEGQFQQRSHATFLVGDGAAGAGARSKDCRAWLRLARDSSPRWLPTRRPSAL
ncbi:hypothetical protein D3C78_503810 [compost metagenome]